MTSGIHCNIAEHQYCMTARRIVETLPQKRLYVYFASLAAKPVDLPKFMIVSVASRALTGTFQAPDHRTPRSNTGQGCLMQSVNIEDEYLLDAVHRKLSPCCSENFDWQNEMKWSENNSSNDWKEELTIPMKYSEYRHKFIIWSHSFRALGIGPWFYQSNAAYSRAW